MTNTNTVGAYFLANDRIFSWAVAFLESFRAHNPDLPLFLIPFDDNYSKIRQLQDRFNFEEYSDPAFATLEKIGRAFESGTNSRSQYWFRRYAAFWGPLEEFIYLDARQLVLADLKPMIKAPKENRFDLLFYDSDITQVYEPGSLRNDLLHRGRGRGFVSGLWASHQGLFSLDEFENLGENALRVRSQLNPRNTDQAFFNFCCDAKGISYAKFSEVLEGLSQTAWARQLRLLYRSNGNYFHWNYGGQDHKKQVVLLHWAGIHLNSTIPHRRLFEYYSLLGTSPTKRFLLQFGARLDCMWRYPFEAFRRNRIVNTMYHRFHKGRMENKGHNVRDK